MKTLKTLSSSLSYLSQPDKSKKGGGKDNKTNDDQGEVGGEWGALMEQEYYDFVLFELPKVVI